ncbi:MAG: redox-sensing transcriptional repressor Rex [Desulfovibrio sp.]|jgi:redox-sensing transcriptional repressor|nr:redox-sensing transcriptional repressor Rex [Desulfovibrio sp.]
MRVGNLPGIRRLPIYLDILRKLSESGLETVSAHILAEEAGLLVSVVRKDIEMTGATGKTGVGFCIDALVSNIETFLGWDNPYYAFLAGVGNLGSALLGYEGFRNHGLHIVAAFDVNPEAIGRVVHEVEVLHLDTLCGLAQRLHVSTGIITVPSAQAQGVADLFVTAGITRIWSFAPKILRVPSNVTIQREDLAAGLAELLVRSARRSERRPLVL